MSLPGIHCYISSLLHPSEWIYFLLALASSPLRKSSRMWWQVASMSFYFSSLWLWPNSLDLKRLSTALSGLNVTFLVSAPPVITLYFSPLTNPFLPSSLTTPSPLPSFPAERTLLVTHTLLAVSLHTGITPRNRFGGASLFPVPPEIQTLPLSPDLLSEPTIVIPIRILKPCI